MLTNMPRRTVVGDLDRRWMSDDYFDLIVWYESGEQIHGFQLCYDKPHAERALTWTRDAGFLHTAVDTGEAEPTENRTPILTADGAFSRQQVRSEFVARSASLPAEIRGLVLTCIDNYSNL